MVGWTACRAQAEPPDYRFDVKVQFPNPEYVSGGDPKASIQLGVIRHEDEFRLRPKVRVELVPCSRSLFLDIPGGENGIWTNTLELDCASKTEHPAEGAQWRLVFEDHEGKVWLPRDVQVEFKPKRVLITDRSGSYVRLQGGFRADAFEIVADGKPAEQIRWVPDPSPLGTHRLVAKIGRGAGSRGTDSPSTDSPRPAESVASRNRPTNSAPIVQAQTTARRLLFRLQGPRRPDAWPDLRVWLKSVETEAWLELPVSGDGIDTERPLPVDVPEALEGKTLEVQVIVNRGQESAVLPIVGRDGKTWPLARISPSQPLWSIPLQWQPLPTHRLEVNVLDSSNHPVEGAVLAAWLYRGHEVIERITLVTDRQGIGSLGLEKTGSTLQIVCTKPGYSAGGRLFSVRQGLPESTHCPMQLQEPHSAEPAPVIGGRVIDPQNKVPIEGAEVRVTWSPSAPPMRTTSGQSGYWWMPAPGPPPLRARVEVDAPCYRSFVSELELTIARSIPLEHLCKEVSLSFQAVQAGTGTVIRQPRRATARIRQGGKTLADGIRFDGTGFNDSQASTVFIDPDRGPIDIEVSALGYAPFVFRARPDDLITDTGFAPDLTFRLRPAGGGLAVLINAAEAWNDYPRALEATVHALSRQGREAGFPEHVLLGSFQQPRFWTETEMSSVAGIQNALAWLGGLGAAGSQLTPDRLATELSGLSSHWPRAGDWDLVVILPHVPWASKNAVLDHELQDLVRELGEGKVTVHILEVGGSLKALRALADSLGGRYTSLESPQEVEAALGKTLEQTLGQTFGKNVGRHVGERGASK